MIPSTRKVLVLGASTNPERYSNKAIHLLLDCGFEVFAIGNKTGQVRGVEISKEKIYPTSMDTVTLYLSAKNQTEWMDYIMSLKPIRVVFNPGAENPAFEKLLREHQIQTEEACTLVMLRLGVF
ncbi:MAG: CoA-binding protein [Crocinitomicaceae bacterium]|nr:CoA-binding protein [Crocinitomicaceae bacterium]